MVNVKIKYNPYKPDTVITVDDCGLQQNNVLRKYVGGETRLQEWVEKLPEFFEDLNEDEINVTFHGTRLDYEDVVLAYKAAQLERIFITGELIHLPVANEDKDRERLIDEVFSKIKDGPFPELYSEDIIRRYESARSRYFEISVVASMSAGKSTLINAMLGTKLLPTDKGACTAKITRIIGMPSVDAPFRVDVLNKDGEIIETIEQPTYEKMKQLNTGDEDYNLEITGNIPFVSSDEISLVFVDTPGPDYILSERHAQVQGEYLENAAKRLVIFVLPLGYEGAGSDEQLIKLLESIAGSMKRGGKFSKDRFLFVVSKLDTINDGDESKTDDILKKVRKYLSDKKIDDANLFPTSAETALWIRMLKNGVELSRRMERDVEYRIKTLNDDESLLHLEAYASLPKNLRDEINAKLALTRAEWENEKKPEFENPEEALIHTGVLSLEAAIKQYIDKYARAIKIKEIADAFMDKLKEKKYDEDIKDQIVKNRENKEEIVKKLDAVSNKIKDAREAQKFKDNVTETVEVTIEKARTIVENANKDYQTQISNKIKTLSDAETITPEAAKAEVEALEVFAEVLVKDFENKLDKLGERSFVSISAELTKSYKNKLASLAEDVNVRGIQIDPKSMTRGSLHFDNISVDTFTYEEEYVSGYYKKRNPNFKWYNPFSWHKINVPNYINKSVVSLNDLAQGYLAPVQEELINVGNGAVEYAIEQTNKIADEFNKEFDRLDNILFGKLNEFKRYATDQEYVDKKLEELEQNLEWLNRIDAKVNEILEI